MYATTPSVCPRYRRQRTLKATRPASTFSEERPTLRQGAVSTSDDRRAVSISTMARNRDLRHDVLSSFSLLAFDLARRAPMLINEVTDAALNRASGAVLLQVVAESGWIAGHSLDIARELMEYDIALSPLPLLDTDLPQSLVEHALPSMRTPDEASGEISALGWEPLWWLRESMMNAATERSHDIPDHRIDRRRRSGTFYTPRTLVGSILDMMDGAGTATSLFDPTCGTGNFLVERLIRRSLSMEDAPASTLVADLFGVDLDPLSVATTRLRLFGVAMKLRPHSTHEEAVAAAETLKHQIIYGDAVDLLIGSPPNGWPSRHAAIAGNPPFINQIRSQPAFSEEYRASIRSALNGRLLPYTDLATILLDLAIQRLDHGGVLALCLPISTAAARDAGPTRAMLNDETTLHGMIVDTSGSFEAAVSIIVPVLRRSTVQVDSDVTVACRGRHGSTVLKLDRPNSGLAWAEVVALALGVPISSRVRALDASEDRLSRIATATADFRDQYYFIVKHTREWQGDHDDRHPRIVTSGSIDPSLTRWGSGVRVGGTAYDRPILDLDDCELTEAVAAWVKRRTSPKVILATQSKVIESYVDTDGSYLPSVPLISIYPKDPRHLHHIQAVLLSPTVTSLTLLRGAGMGLSPSALKLTARAVELLPLPSDEGLWNQAASVHAGISDAGVLDTDELERRLLHAGRLMSSAYGDSEASFPWWSSRLSQTLRRHHGA